MTLDSDEQQLAAYRALRDEAWALVKDDIDALKLDLEMRGLGARLADRVGEEAREVWEQTLEVAEAHRSIVGATLLALVAWLLRGPIVQGAGALFGGEDDKADGGGEAEAGAARPVVGQRQEQGERT